MTIYVLVRTMITKQIWWLSKQTIRRAKQRKGGTRVSSKRAVPLAGDVCTHAPSSLSRVMNLITRYSRSVCQRGGEKSREVER